MNKGEVSFNGSYQEFKQKGIEITEKFPDAEVEHGEKSGEDMKRGNPDSCYSERYPSITEDGDSNDETSKVDSNSVRRKSILKYARRQSRRNLSGSKNSQIKSKREVV